MRTHRWWSWDEDRRPSLNRLTRTGGEKWFDMAKVPEPCTTEMEVRTEHDFRLPLPMGVMKITSSGPGDFDGILTMSIHVADGFTLE